MSQWVVDHFVFNGLDFFLGKLKSNKVDQNCPTWGSYFDTIYTYLIKYLFTGKLWECCSMWERRWTLWAGGCERLGYWLPFWIVTSFIFTTFILQDIFVKEPFQIILEFNSYKDIEFSLSAIIALDVGFLFAMSRSYKMDLNIF